MTKQIVPYGKAKVAKGIIDKASGGKLIKLPGGRRVNVWKLKDDEGFYANIRCPTLDGKTSELHFALRTDAAMALCQLLIQAQQEIILAKALNGLKERP